MKTYFPNLRAEMARNGVTCVDLARVTGKTDKSMRNKLSGNGDFTLTEVMNIWKNIFPEMDMDYLFYRGE